MLCEGFCFSKHGCMGNSGLVGYPSDVRDEEWGFVAPYLALCREDAPQRTHSLRAVLNGLRYIVKSGMQWRMMPHDRKRTASLSITHNLSAQDEAELDVCEACKSPPHDGVSWWRVFGSGQVASEPGELGEIKGECAVG